MPLVLCGLSGLNPPGREYTTQIYLGIHGQETVSERLLPRTVTLSIERRPECGMTVGELYRILSCTGTLTVWRDNRAYTVSTNQVTVSEAVEKGDFTLFTAQYVCDNPYFTDKAPRRIVCFETENQIRYENGSWTLGTEQTPVVWTTTNSTKEILNEGDAPAEPKIVIYGVGTPEEGAFIELQITDTAGALLSRMVLNYAIADGETVTVNCDGRNPEGRFIVSDRNGDIVSYKSGETSLSKFRFPVGKSVFRLLNHSETGRLKAYAELMNLYEAVSLWN